MAEIANDPLYLWKAYCDKKMELEDAQDRIEALETLLQRWYETGCPNCGGDCGSANPPVIGCIVQDTHKLLRSKQ